MYNENACKKQKLVCEFENKRLTQYKTSTFHDKLEYSLQDKQLEEADNLKWNNNKSDMPISKLLHSLQKGIFDKNNYNFNKPPYMY